MQIGVVACPAHTIPAIIKAGKVQIGWVISRIRIAIKIDRCYRCHGFGHLAEKCKGNIRGAHICRKFSEGGHKLVDCKAAPACRLCRKKGFARLDHTAGSLACKVYKDFIASRGAPGIGSKSRNA